MERASHAVKPLLQAKFDRQSNRGAQMPCGFNSLDVVHIAVHIRRGDVPIPAPGSKEWTFGDPHKRAGSPDAYFIQVMRSPAPCCGCSMYVAAVHPSGFTEC